MHAVRILTHKYYYNAVDPEVPSVPLWKFDDGTFAVFRGDERNFRVSSGQAKQLIRRYGFLPRLPSCVVDVKPANDPLS